jgi:hypothetical protein
VSATRPWSTPPRWSRRLARVDQRGSAGASSPDLVGLDLANAPGRLQPRPRISAPLVLIGVLGALVLVALRVDLTRMRYAQADALAEERRLLEEQSDLTVEMRRLRDPSRLAERARELGFERPERVIDLPGAPAALPMVSAPPPSAEAAP